MNVSGDYDRRVGFVDHVWRGERLWVARGTLGKVIAPTSFITARNSHDESTESTRFVCMLIAGTKIEATTVVVMRRPCARLLSEREFHNRQFRDVAGVEWDGKLSSTGFPPATMIHSSDSSWQSRGSRKQCASRTGKPTTTTCTTENRRSDIDFFRPPSFCCRRRRFPLAQFTMLRSLFRSSRLHVNRADSLCGAIEER